MRGAYCIVETTYLYRWVHHEDAGGTVAPGFGWLLLDTEHMGVGKARFQKMILMKRSADIGCRLRE